MAQNIKKAQSETVHFEMYFVTMPTKWYKPETKGQAMRID